MRTFTLLLMIFFINKVSAGNAIIWGPSGSAKVLNKQGGLLLNTASATCAAAIAGSLRWQASTLEVCTGSSWTTIATGSSGVTTMAAIGASPNANGATISSSTLNLEPASASFGGVVTTGTQTFAGNKTFSGNLQFNGNPTYFGAADAALVLAAAPDFIFDTPTGNHTAVEFTGPNAEGALAMITLTAGGFYLQGTASNDGTGSTAQPLYVNPQGGQAVIGNAVNSVTFTGYTSCTALTTNGSAVVGCTASDERLKKDIVPFERGLEALKDIKPITFKFKDPGDLGVEHSGFSAQNVEKSISEAVRMGSDGNRMLDYWTIIATQTNAINELRARLEALEGPTATVKSKKSLPQKAIWKAPPPPLPFCVNGHKKNCVESKAK